MRDPVRFEATVTMAPSVSRRAVSRLVHRFGMALPLQLGAGAPTLFQGRAEVVRAEADDLKD